MLVGKLELNTQRPMWVWLRIYLTGFNDTILKQKPLIRAIPALISGRDR